MDLLRARRAELEVAVREAMAQQLPDRREIELSALVDLRYRGQDKPLTLPLPAAETAESLGSLLGQAFREAHQATYGYLRAEAPEIAALRLRGTAAAGVGRSIAVLAGAAKPHARAASGRKRLACFDAGHGMIEVPVLERADLGERAAPGPLIVEEWDTTAVVPPGWSAARDGLNNIVLERSGGAKP
jgi:N-methylhydantoinase A